MLLPRDAPKTIVTRISPVLPKGALGTRMIPTIRSMIVAVLLTVTVLVGGFGLFAAFRVNHEPLARLPVAATPFQLASIDGAPRALSFTSDQPRLETTEGLRAVAAAVAPVDPDQTDAPAPPLAVPVDDVAPQTAPLPERLATATVSDATATEPPDNPAPSPVATDVAAAPPSAAAQLETSETLAPAAETPPPEAAVAAASPPSTSQPETVAVTGSITEMPPQQAGSPVTAAPKTSADRQETAREIPNRKRLAALRHTHRARVAARAQAPIQNNGFGQTNFQSASGFQSAQSGIGGPFVSPPPAARRQN
jgi:hypothetical protein